MYKNETDNQRKPLSDSPIVFKFVYEKIKKFNDLLSQMIYRGRFLKLEKINFFYKNSLNNLVVEYDTGELFSDIKK